MFYQRDPGWPAACLDRTDETVHPHPGLAFQRGPLMDYVRNCHLPAAGGISSDMSRD